MVDKDALKKVIDEYQKQNITYENLEDLINKEEILSHEYQTFKRQVEASKKPKNWYERIVRLCGNLGITLADKDRERIEKSIRFSNLNVTPEQIVVSSLIFLGLSLVVQVIFYLLIHYFAVHISKDSILAFLRPDKIPVLIEFLPSFIGVIGAYFLYKYPSMLSTRNRIEEGEQLLMAIVYMIVYLRTSGNLEGALRYAARNTHGKVSEDLGELLWKIEMREYLDVYTALNDYAMKWKDHMKEFSQAIYLINEGMIDPDRERRDRLLEKALNVVLDSYDERMKQYARALELPIQIIHALGIILPVLGMVVLPILTILLSDSLSNLSFYLISFYDITLPIILIFFINNTLEKRPPTFGRIHILNHPSLPKRGYFRVTFNNKSKDIKINNVLFSILLFVLLPSLLLFLINYYHNGNSVGAIDGALLSVISFASLLSINAYLFVFNRLSIREAIENIEKEFEDALFSLGNALAGGMPLEKALSKAIEDLNNLKIKELFEGILKNIHQFGLTFKDALFHPKYGVMKYYPSELIKNILTILSSVIEKGTQNAALAMITISRYLKDIKTTQEKIEDLLSSTLSSMRFNAYVLIPVVGGVIVAVSKLVLVLLLKMSNVYSLLSQQLASANVQQIMETGFMFSVDQAIPASLSLFIIGVYIVEMLYVLGLFIARTQYGYDEIMEKKEIWKLVLIGTAVFAASYILINGLFSGVIDNIIDSLQTM